MRLTCPNCDAQYEVPVGMIPEAGRDVQCSSCGHAWYQNRPGDDSMLTAKSDQLAEAVATSEATEPTTTPSQQPLHDANDDDEDAPSSLPRDSARLAIVRTRALDPAVAEVLREEASRESRQRATEFSSLESQPELGLNQPRVADAAARRIRESHEFTAPMQRHQQPAEPVATPSAPNTAPAPDLPFRRDLLPDVEEIDQSLRPTREQPRAQRRFEPPQSRAIPDDEPRSSFGRGFIAVLLLAVIIGALYIFAPQIGEALPAAKPLLVEYVSRIDLMRLWLDSQVSSLLLYLEGLSAEPTADN
ncbi:zinc-ribbon domain-containing protein [Puniceibacterium sediminis]|uniref:MJ0042 family finger-like domain-containing protein n=1 Tax=Puniceibacterium sediminis TaxID=1608407 RepID=A0A238WKS8_9RHOB|nr:zinc-ribbon domain-containing protein [Puniceibacterium sediminis]SNR46951.1 MJ0042 family finger-like domain-containing protein [Puniceibacterium sediminis]